MSEWIGVDLDGTLAIYDEHTRSVGGPVKEMVARVKLWLAAGREVRIFTARAYPLPCIKVEDEIEHLVGANDHEALAIEQVKMIRAWCLEHLGHILPVTCSKDYGMLELWDDRAVRVEPNTGRLLSQPYRQPPQ